jgi:hypothetical protein
MGRTLLCAWGVALACLLVACGGGGGAAEPVALTAPPPSSPPPANNEPDPSALVTVSGKVTFERVPFRSAPAVGLDYAAQSFEPARGISFEVRRASSNVVLASGITDANGDFSASVPSGTNIYLRAIARMVKTSGPLPHWNFSVRDVNNDGPVYSHQGAAFDSGAGSSSANLAIPSGWAITGGSDGTRAAAPFAVLDVIYDAVSLVLTAAPDTSFPILAVDWSPQNPGAMTYYSNDAGGDGRHIVLSGEADVDTDEYDTYVIAHEFGHYIEDRFSRSDSIGGSHSFMQRLDPRVAFGEGFGNAFAAMVTGSPLMRDSAGSGQLSEGRFNVENDMSDDGWFSESSVQEILYDLFDAANEGGDSLNVGFQPIWQVLSGAERSTPAVTSIFPFITALKQALPASAAQIDQLVSSEGIDSATMDAFGTAETNFPNTAAQSDVLPVYADITVGGPARTVRSTGLFGSENKLSNHRFLKLVLPMQRNVRIVAGAASRDVDVVILRGAEVLRFAQENGPSDEDFSILLPAGTYVLDVFDCGNAACGPDQPATTDITVSVN